MSFLFQKLGFKSIKMRVVVLISTLIASAIFFITLMVLFIVNMNMNDQMNLLLKTRANSIYEKLDQRIGYLIENSVLLTKNELIINSFIDKKGRATYLPPLVDNFMEGKDVLYLNLVDFDGRAIFQTQENIPLYNQSTRLRAALALGKASYYIEEDDDKLVIIAPIEYYSTTQGAAIIVFKVGDVASRILADDQDIYIKLFEGETNIFTYNFQEDQEYHSASYISERRSFLKQLNVFLELGIPLEIYMAPIKDIFIKLLILGLLFIIIGVLLSTLLANGITKPIITLFNRVKNSSRSNEIFCSPLGTNDELEELAKAFDERSLLLQHQAQYDSLTNLPNRLFFLEKIEQSIEISLGTEQSFAVLFLDLDHFKEINDSLGHHFGDKLLVIVGEYLKNTLKGSDLVARMGGDEFTILLNDLDDNNKIIRTLQNLIHIFKKPFVIDQHQFYITCSIGIALYPLHGRSAEELLKNSDAAMYKAKEKGRNTYEFYTDDMTEKAYERVRLETQLREAVENEEFEVYFQPQVDINSSFILGMEALVRWNHPLMGLVPPDKFIALAEDTGLIVDIDRKVMQDAMLQFQEWIEQGFQVGVLSVNLSMIQLNRKDFMQFVKNSIKTAKISPKNLMFEVTETQVMKNPKQAIIILQQLQDIGIRLAIDDFGTGHSSLSYIKKLPIDKLKIDQSFVRDILIDKDDRELTRAIISIAKSLQLEVIAEGVETEEQAHFLVENGCFEAQGYLYYKPLNVEHITEILVSKKS